MRCAWYLAFLGWALVALGQPRLVKRQEGGVEFPEDEIPPGSPCSTNTGAGGRCVPLVRCPFYTSDVELLAQNVCPLQSGGNENGVCCPNAPVTPPGESPVRPPTITPFSQTPVPGLTIRSNDIGESSSAATENIQERDELERTLLQRGLVVQPGTTEALHLAIVFADPISQALGRQGLLATETSKDLSTRLNLSPSQSTFALPKVSIAQTPVESTCPKEPVCPATKYRTLDGSCNNLEHRDWGKSSRAFQRMMPPMYADGLSQPRVATDGTPLPSARLVSTTILKANVVEYPDISIFFQAFGQFVDHDITLTPTTRGANGTGIRCCPPEITPELRHPECMMIDIPGNDPFYQQFSQTCMEFVRTIVAPPPTCTLGPREQINSLTNYIDGSQIYGSTDQQADRLRSKNGGKLRAGGGNVGREFPPHSNGGGCTGDGSRQFCFQAGDVRAVEQPPLATIQVAFFREHNRIADELAKLNPGWSDEVLYQETRRIVGAIIQNVVYNEFLPVVLGNRVMKRFDLTLQKEGFKDGYDPNLDATIFNEFATAAYRFGHSAVPGLVKLLGEGNQESSQQLRDHFLQSYDTSMYNNYVRGLITQGSEVIDENVTPEITNHLFQRNNQFGLDLPAINMQRGRDHAIGTYTQARKTCGLEEVKSFQDLSKFMEANIANQFSQLYKNVDDIDLWIGGVVEKPLPGATVGPTFACIIAEQFKRSKNGDRFWFERGNTESAFSEAQLAQIRQSSLARILCDNSDITSVQPLALLKPTSWNQQVPCDSQTIPKMSFRPWRNEPVWTK